MTAVETTSGRRCVRRWYGTYPSCTCAACEPIRARMKKRSKAGLLPKARSDEAWEVIDTLLARGWSPLAIASAAGVSDRGMLSALQTRREGRPRRFGRAVAERIIGHGEPTRGYVSAVGPCRRLQALAAVGWSLEALSERSGVPVMTLSTVRSGRLEHVRPGTARVVDEIFRAHAWTPGPHRHAVDHAAAQGWVSPLAWDDIDDPAEKPRGIHREHKKRHMDEIAIARALAGPASTPDLTAEERRVVVARLDALGCSGPQIAAHLRVDVRTVQRDREALGLVVRRAEAVAS